MEESREKRRREEKERREGRRERRRKQQKGSDWMERDQVTLISCFFSFFFHSFSFIQVWSIDPYHFVLLVHPHTFLSKQLKERGEQNAWPSKSSNSLFHLQGTSPGMPPVMLLQMDNVEWSPEHHNWGFYSNFCGYEPPLFSLFSSFSLFFFLIFFLLWYPLLPCSFKRQ